MSDQSYDQPQYETIDVPPTAESLIEWARRLLADVPLADNTTATSWSHQRLLWEKSYEMYRDLEPQVIPTVEKHEWTDGPLAPLLMAPEEQPLATLTLLSDAGPILGLPIGTKPEQVRWAEEVAVEWWSGPRPGEEPLVLPWPLDVRDLRG